jgi:hypothetical protein
LAASLLIFSTRRGQVVSTTCFILLRGKP